MKRMPVNPWSWSQQYSFNQAEVIEGVSRYLVCAGQTAFDGEGRPQHAGDMRAQMTLALDNLEAVLDAADMTLAHVIHLRIYTTDVDQTLGNWTVLTERLATAGIMPPQTLLGVARLATPELMIEIEATAAA